MPQSSDSGLHWLVIHAVPVSALLPAGSPSKFPSDWLFRTVFMAFPLIMQFIFHYSSVFFFSLVAVKGSFFAGEIFALI